MLPLGLVEDAGSNRGNAGTKHCRKEMRKVTDWRSLYIGEIWKHLSNGKVQLIEYFIQQFFKQHHKEMGLAKKPVMDGLQRHRTTKTKSSTRQAVDPAQVPSILRP